MDQLDKQLDKKEFQEIGSMVAFKVLETQFHMFIKSQIYLDDAYVVMTRNYFLQYTQLTILEFRDTLIQHMESVKKDKLKKEHVIKESMTAGSGAESVEQDTSSKSGNDVHADDADIIPIYDEEPMVEIHMTAEVNIFATGQQYTKQPKFNNEGEVDLNTKQFTTHYFPKERESVVVKPHHVIASSKSKNSSKNMPRFSSNDMVHNHYLEEAKKKTQGSGRNSRPNVIPSSKLQSTANGSKPKPRSNNQNSRNWPASKSSSVTTKTVPIAEHPRNSRNFSDSKHFVCLTCQKCVFNTNHDSCVTKFLKEVNSRAKVLKAHDGNLKLLSNFVEKFLGAVKFRTDQIASILGYGDLNDIVIGLPKLKFIKDHLCSYCELEKAKQKSFHTKTTPSSKRRLQLLHMDLCSPMQVESINGKKYVPVTIDDYSRYTWTHILRSKDETPEVLIDFLRLVQRGLHAQALEHASLSPGPQIQGNVPQADETVTTSNELDFLFSLMFNELLNETTQVMSKTSVVTIVDAPNQRQQQHITPSTSTIVAEDTSPLNIQKTTETTSQAATPTPTVTAKENIIQAETNKEHAQVDENEFINIFSTPVQERGETSSRYVDS
nr:ribonuclease H-like domain-containing protein [Tanacetum cinerariifolium]